LIKNRKKQVLFEEDKKKGACIIKKIEKEEEN
jgi:hypothetical protein